jgi:hypothetical protein
LQHFPTSKSARPESDLRWSAPFRFSTFLRPLVVELPNFRE